jgi:hypothetical protein
MLTVRRCGAGRRGMVRSVLPADRPDTTPDLPPATATATATGCSDQRAVSATGRPGQPAARPGRTDDVRRVRPVRPGSGCGTATTPAAAALG